VSSEPLYIIDVQGKSKHKKPDISLMPNTFTFNMMFSCSHRCFRITGHVLCGKVVEFHIQYNIYAEYVRRLESITIDLVKMSSLNGTLQNTDGYC